MVPIRLAIPAVQDAIYIRFEDSKAILETVHFSRTQQISIFAMFQVEYPSNDTNNFETMVCQKSNAVFLVCIVQYDRREIFIHC